QPATYPAVPPLQWVLGLNQSSRAHSVDLANTAGCAFQHNSCDGTLWYTRISSFYPNTSALGENAAAGYSDPLSMIIGLLLDSDLSGVPALDGTGYDGHRWNIM